MEKRGNNRGRNNKKNYSICLNKKIICKRGMRDDDFEVRRGRSSCFSLCKKIYGIIWCLIGGDKNVNESERGEAKSSLFHFPAFSFIPWDCKPINHYFGVFKYPCFTIIKKTEKKNTIKKWDNL